MSDITLYRHPLSGHSHRVELFLSLLKLPAHIVDVDLMAGEQKTASFLNMNPLGQVPVLQDCDITLYDSNAILVYLANKYDPKATWFPEDPLSQATIQQVLTLGAGPLIYGPARARLITVFNADYDVQGTIDHAHEFLTAINNRLKGHAWLANEHPTIADISIYPYVAHAPEGNVSLKNYTYIQKWLTRIEALPGFIPMQSSAAGLAA